MDLVALEKGELGPLLSPGTLHNLEDECITDVKVLGLSTGGASLQVGRQAAGNWGGGVLLHMGPSPPPFTLSNSLLYVFRVCSFLILGRRNGLVFTAADAQGQVLALCSKMTTPSHAWGTLGSARD